MSATRAAVSDRWIANAAELDRCGYFSEYSRDQRDEVLRKGYIGVWPPDQALGIAAKLAQRRLGFVTSKFYDDLRRYFSLAADEVWDTIIAVLAEAPASSYKPPRTLERPPGSPFIFRSATLQAEIYFKFQLTGSRKKPQVVFWSCHPPDY